MKIEVDFKTYQVDATQPHAIAHVGGYQKAYSTRFNRMVYKDRNSPRYFARIAGQWEQTYWNERHSVWFI